MENFASALKLWITMLPFMPANMKSSLTWVLCRIRWFFRSSSKRLSARGNLWEGRTPAGRWRHDPRRCCAAPIWTCPSKLEQTEKRKHWNKYTSLATTPFLRKLRLPENLHFPRKTLYIAFSLSPPQLPSFSSVINICSGGQYFRYFHQKGRAAAARLVSPPPETNP